MWGNQVRSWTCAACAPLLLFSLRAVFVIICIICCGRRSSLAKNATQENRIKKIGENRGGGVAVTGDGGVREMRGLAALTGMVVMVVVMHWRPARGAQDKVGAAGVRTRRSRPR